MLGCSVSEGLMAEGREGQEEEQEEEEEEEVVNLRGGFRMWDLSRYTHPLPLLLK